MQDEVTLDISALRNRAAELGLKRDWLARRVADITLARAEDQLATPADQKAAARALVASRAMDKLGALGEWDVLESLLKASLAPGLPLHVLGELYDKLCIACWRQSKLDLAGRYANKARDIALRCGDKTLLAASLHNLANLGWWRGEINDALALYRQCLAMKTYLPPRMVCAVQSNLGSVLWELGETGEALELLRAALRGFARHGTPMNRSIAHCQLAMVYLEEGDLGQARRHNHRARREGAREEYNRAEPMGELLAAEIHVRGGGQARRALAQAQRALNEFARLNIAEGLNYLIAARVARHACNYAQAQAWLHRALKLTEKFPLERARALEEAYYLECARRISTRATEAVRRRAAAALRKAGATRRA